MVRGASGVQSRVQPASQTVEILPIRRPDPETGVYPLRARIQGHLRVRPLRTMHHHRLGVQRGLPSPLDVAPNPGRRTPARLASADPSIESCLGMTSTTLFRDYINTWIKVKQEADGRPSPEVEKDPALQIEYLEEFRSVEGVILDPAKIERNEGRRTLGKLMANSFWGKFGQRTNKTQVTTCKDPESFFDIFLDGKRDIHRILPAGEQMIDVYHSFKEDVGELGTNTNIFVAAFTTAHARVKLYHDGLLPLHTRVLYMDTDSVVYLATQGETHLPRGRFLGQFKDELKGDVINEFVAGGTKNYAYRTRSGQECCNVRGFTLDARGQAVLNFESVRSLVQLDMNEPLDRPRTLSVDNPHHIVRNVTDKTLHSVPQRKTYCMVQDKR
ncbi:unnamed protein product, partial [Porites lobata]